MHFRTTAVFLFAGVVLSTASFADDDVTSSVVAINASSNGSVTVLGGLEARQVRLDLGPLRTKDAKLPGGIVSKEDRMRIRAERAEARRIELDEAKR